MEHHALAPLEITDVIAGLEDAVSYLLSRPTLTPADLREAAQQCAEGSVRLTVLSQQLMTRVLEIDIAAGRTE